MSVPLGGVWGSAIGDVHLWFSWVVIVANALAGLWSLAAHWMESARGRALWVFITVAQLAIFAQVILGVILQNSEDLEPKQFHNFYGFVSLAAVGIIYSYRGQVAAEYKYLLYGGGGLFLMGMAIRATLLNT